MESIMDNWVFLKDIRDNATVKITQQQMKANYINE